jgi:predicted RNA binding protein YcfA (HicA-like mRNA interferase family)
MSKLPKLIKQLLKDLLGVCFDDVQYLLASFGFVEKRSRGNHHAFRNANGLKITVPKKGGKMAKGIYVQQMVTLLNLEDWNHENSD